MIQRLRHRQFFTTPIQEQMETPPTVFEELLMVFRRWDLLSTVHYDRYAYEETVVELIRRLESLSTRDDVEAFIYQLLAEHIGSSHRAPESVRLIITLAEDIFVCW